MKLQVYSIFDKAVHAYMPPFFSRAKGEALRSFTQACNDDQSNLRKFANDYTLYFLGEFDDNAGMFEPVDPQRVVSAVECMVDDPFTADTQQMPLPGGRKNLPM